jgi:hypothetical protein
LEIPRHTKPRALDVGVIAAINAAAPKLAETDPAVYMAFLTLFVSKVAQVRQRQVIVETHFSRREYGPRLNNAAANRCARPASLGFISCSGHSDGFKLPDQLSRQKRRVLRIWITRMHCANKQSKRADIVAHSLGRSSDFA